MSAAQAGVAIVIPALGRSASLERALDSLARALLARGAADEVVVVDDSGRGELGRRDLEPLQGRARIVARGSNGGFGAALCTGVEAARRELVFAMNSDVRVRPGFLEPLQQALQDDAVFAAAPRVLRRPAGDSAGTRAAARDASDDWGVESLTRLEFAGGMPRVRQPGVEPDAAPARGPKLAAAGGRKADLERESGSDRDREAALAPHGAFLDGAVLREVRPIPFALGGACLMRRAQFLELGLDPLFEPFYLEDVDLCWRAWRRGQRVVHVPEAIVEHENQGTIAAVAKRATVLAAIERNQLLFAWKHLDGAALEAHLEALAERACQAWIDEDRRDLEVLALALERAEAALAARRALPPACADFAALARRSDPFEALDPAPTGPAARTAQERGDGQPG